MVPLRALATLLFVSLLSGAQSRLIIDTDAGSDDFMAVALLLAHPRIRIDAITVVNGTAHVTAGVRNMERLLDLAGRKDVPVFAGRNEPLRGHAEFPAEWRRISDDLPGVSLPPASRAPESRHAAEYLAERLRSATEPVRILALGPLTNIAEALERNPGISSHIRELVFLGGAVYARGNLQDGGVFHTKNSTAEWNIYVDPFAAGIVFRSGVPIRMIALDATDQVKIGPDFVREFKARARSPLGRVVAQVLEADREVIAQGFFYAWDPLAAAALLRPGIVKTAALHIEIREEGPQQGRTAATPSAPNAQVAIGADGAAFRTMFLESFAR